VPLPLPASDATLLAAERSPLELVVVQVRFDPRPASTDPGVALLVHQQLGGPQGRFARVVPVQTQTAQFIVGSAPRPEAEVTQAPAGWHLADANDTWTASVMAESLALTTTRYPGWSEFRQQLASLITAGSEMLTPVFEQRLGLRYVNRLTQPGGQAPADWQGLIADALLSAVLHPALGDLVRTTQQQVDLDLGEGVHCTLRHGVFVDPARAGQPSYLIDIDIFRDQSRPFDAGAILTILDNFNELALGIFQQAITPKLLAFLQGKETT
jgi:uncharacterized protein (TIGR04255 family)